MVSVGEEEEDDDMALMLRPMLTWPLTRRDDVTLCLSRHHLTDAA